MYCECEEDDRGNVTKLCEAHKSALSGMKCLIWSIEHNAWWSPNERGYTPLREEAGRYSFENACRIVKSANRIPLTLGNTPNEAMIEDVEG